MNPATVARASRNRVDPGLGYLSHGFEVIRPILNKLLCGKTDSRAEASLF